jgi:opacity protein-like surface antigen
MMKFKLAITCLAIIACTSMSQAQHNMFSLQYSIGFPSGSLSDYISETSFRGFGIDYKYVTPSNFAFGLDAGINTFYERKGYDTYTEETVTITGTQYHYTNSVPILASIAYYLAPDQMLNPYASLGIGTIYTRRDTDIGLYRSEINTWQFGLRPEIGIIYNFTPKFGVKVAGKYYQAFETNELGAQSYAALDVGLVFTSAP